MKKMTVMKLCTSAVLVALHIVLELFCTVRIGNDLKITFATLPFILAGMLLGPVLGLLTGLVGTFLSQMLTYGITITTPFWVLPGVLTGLCAALVFMAFKKKAKLVPVGVTVAASCVALTLANLFASYMDGVVIYKYWTVEVMVALIPMRFLICAGLIVIYTAVTLPIYKILQKEYIKRG